MAGQKTAELVRAYYHTWKNGLASYDEARLRRLLAADLAFEGPIAGARSGAEPFLKGILGLIKVVEGLRFVQTVYAEDEAAMLYDCDLVPDGTIRFAEFVSVERGRIQPIKVAYDATEYRRLVGAGRPASAP